MIVAIIGGALLTLALTRPDLEWLKSLIDTSDVWRRTIDRAISIFAFVVAGYTYAALFITLEHSVSAEDATLIRGAAWFLLTYAWMIHFRPFLPEWLWPGEVIGATVFFLGCIYAALMCGVLVATSEQESLSLRALESFLRSPVLVVLACWIFSRLMALSTWTSAERLLLFVLTQRLRRA